MKRNSIAFSILVSLAGSVQAQTCSPISAPITIDAPGSYCLTNNVTGHITITASPVSLDLNSFEVSAGGAAQAITITNAQQVKVFNGTISNTTNAGIFADTCTSIELSNLYMKNNALDAIRVEDSKDVTITNVNFTGNTGERALNFDTCTNINVDSGNITNYVSTLGALVQLQSCSQGAIKNLNINNNTKALAVNTGSASPAAYFVAGLGCNHINFDHIVITHNTLAPTAPATATLRHNLIGFRSSQNCSISFCETSQNTDTFGGINNVDHMVLINLSDNISVTNHACNNNSCQKPILAFYGLRTLDTDNAIYDACAANHNIVQALAVNPDFFAEYFLLKGTLVAFSLNNMIVRNSQANNNICVDGGAGRSPLLGNFGFIIGIEIEGNPHIEHCEANFNAMLSAEPLTFTTGIFVDTASNGLITHSTASYNSGGAFSNGITVAQLFGTGGTDLTVSHCTANSNSGDGLQIGNILDQVSTSMNNILVSDSTFNNNFHPFNDVAGIRILPQALGTSNVLIQRNQINGNYSGTGLAAGIFAPQSNNVIVEDTNICSTNIVPPVLIFDVAEITGTGPFLVTFDINTDFINAAAGFVPFVPGTYQVTGNSNPLYNGTFQAVDSAVGTITLSYPVNPGDFSFDTLTTITFLPSGKGHGVVYDTITDGKIIHSQFHGNKNNGVELTGSNTNIAILDNIAKNNNKGFSVAAGSTLNDGLFQSNRAQGNTCIGFEHAATLPCPFDTVYQKNYAQDNGNNYAITGKIQRHIYDIPKAKYTFVEGGTKLPEFTNIDARTKCFVKTSKKKK